MWHPRGFAEVTTSDGRDRWQHERKATKTKMAETVFEGNRAIITYDAPKTDKLLTTEISAARIQVC